MNIVIDNIQLGNQIIDTIEVGDEIDESLRSIMMNLKNCENGLLKAIQTQISDELLLSNCLLLNDDLNQTSDRYNIALSGNKPTNFISGFGWTTFEEQSKTSYTNEVQPKQKVSVSKINSVQAPSDDIFGISANGRSGVRRDSGSASGLSPLFHYFFYGRICAYFVRNYSGYGRKRSFGSS